MIRISSLDEPFLEFGGGIRHTDIRFGLMDYGPFDAGLEGAPQRVRVGVVGSPETIDGTVAWLDACKTGLPAKKSKQPNLFPRFPGLGPEGAFRCDFSWPSELQRTLLPLETEKLIRISDHADAIRQIVALIAAEVRHLADSNTRPDVVLVALPLGVVERVVNKRVAAESQHENTSEEEETSAAAVDFRALLKAACMAVRLPIQVLWPTTYDSSLKISRKLKIANNRRVQDDATRAWNLLTATYYKANGLPWRLVRDPKALRTSYVGVSFYKSADGDAIHTSTAQMFDERGEGLILRGGRATESKEDRRPHLSEQDAYALLSHSLAVFYKTHGHYPARVVMHKTSNFNDDEISGFDQALTERNIDIGDFSYIGKTMTRLYRQGRYPPLRGTLIRFSKDEAALYCRGSVDFFKTYPGMYVPRPLHIRCQKLAQPLKYIAEETLALTKMNWNNTQFDNGFPITISAARHVGEILKYVDASQEIAPRYSFYM